MAGAPRSRYAARRRMEGTPEPPMTGGGEVDPGSAPPGTAFVVQQHLATRFHHDLRLEMFRGETPVLVSWAVPKGLPRRAGEKVLAVRTEDHPAEYARFSGTIPKGNYGAGEVRIFDAGSYRLIERGPGKLTVRLEGSRVRGVFHLVRTGGEPGKEQWLAILRQDESAPREDPPPPEPMLATLTSGPFDGKDWAFEPKWDGMRAIAVCEGATGLWSRRGREITGTFPELGRLHERLVAREAMLDGEIIAVEAGVPSFAALQPRIHLSAPEEIERRARSRPVSFVAFDLLYLDGRRLVDRPYDERRARLEELVVPFDRLQVTPMAVGAGRAFFDEVVSRGLEGIVAKRRSSRYEPGVRSGNWLKVPAVLEADAVVVGWLPGEGERAGDLGSLLLAVYSGDRLRYLGRVGTGFGERERRGLPAALAALSRQTAPLEPPRGEPGVRAARWVEPRLVAHVAYRQVTPAGRLRAPVFKGLREDKAPEDCRLKDLVPVAAPSRGGAHGKGASAGGEAGTRKAVAAPAPGRRRGKVPPPSQAPSPKVK